MEEEITSVLTAVHILLTIEPNISMDKVDTIVKDYYILMKESPASRI